MMDKESEEELRKIMLEINCPNGFSCVDKHYDILPEISLENSSMVDCTEEQDLTPEKAKICPLLMYALERLKNPEN